MNFVKLIIPTRTRTFLKSSTYGKFITHKLCPLSEKNRKNEEKQGRDPWPMYKFSGSVQPVYPLSAKRYVPPHILRPDYADHPKGFSLGELAISRSDPIKLLTNQEIQCMKIVCKLARECLDIGIRAISPGITTDEIDAILHEAVIERNCYPSPLNYYNFPKSCCTSVNEVICHGIPDQRELEDGDIVNLDVTCYYNGFHGDASETIFVGTVDEKSRSLVQTSHDCLMTAIGKVRPGVAYSDLGQYIEEEASVNGYSVTRSYCGHGINQLFHTVPSVPHHKYNRAVGIMKPGHVFTIEPMINEGLYSSLVWPDDWTVVTSDGKRSAQFEHTVLVTETGVDILTKQDGNGKPYFIGQIENQDHQC